MFSLSLYLDKLLAHPTSIHCVSSSFLQRQTVPKHEANHSLSSRAEVGSMWSSVFSLQNIFKIWYRRIPVYGFWSKMFQNSALIFFFFWSHSKFLQIMVIFSQIIVSWVSILLTFSEWKCNLYSTQNLFSSLVHIYHSGRSGFFPIFRVTKWKVIMNSYVKNILMFLDILSSWLMLLTCQKLAPFHAARIASEKEKETRTRCEVRSYKPWWVFMNKHQSSNFPRRDICNIAKAMKLGMVMTINVRKEKFTDM
jgi:hypothetical protein